MVRGVNENLSYDFRSILAEAVGDDFPRPKLSVVKAEVDDLKERYRAGKVGDVEVKQKLVIAINNSLEPIREKRAYFLAHPMIPNDVLARGIRRMQGEAKATMELVREKTGLSYSLELFVDQVDIFGEYDG